MNNNDIIYKTIYKGAVAEITEKKSRFIASVASVDSESAALQYIEGIKKQHYDARHNCSAFIIAGTPPLTRCNDDGEPQRTAGKPMLDILQANNLVNVVAVVTRYFGGTLLGTGGLVRAYQGALSAAISECTILNKLPGYSVAVETDYNGLGKLQYYSSQNDITVQDIQYTENVTVSLIVPINRIDALTKHITDITAGRADISTPEKIYYADINGKRELFIKP